ncbi:MAG: O-antigen ligase family protein [Candidatus Pelagibacter sp.]
MYVSKNNFFNILLGLVPISFIAGNMLININILLIIFSSIIYFGRDLFKVNYFFLDKLLFLFFFLILITGSINDFYFYSNKIPWKGYYFATIVKSLFFLKYILLYIVLRYLIEKNILNLKLFFFTCFFGTLFVSFDIIYQSINGEDIFGFKGIKNNLSGPFGDELIAGGYIQRFSIFSFFLIPLFYQQNFNRYLKYLIPILFVIFFITIILSGNRMPLLLFLFAISLIIIFNKQTRKFFLPTLIVAILIFYILISFNSKVKVNFTAFYAQISQMTAIVLDRDFKNNSMPPYLKQFVTFYDTWRMHKYIGGGIKNFTYYCHKRPNIDKNSKYICNMHPHNYYLEILTETGIIGFFIITLAFLIIIHLTLVKKYILTSALNKNKLIVPFIFLFLVEIFPLKSTGSFFTTGNATYLFIIIGILIGLMRKENLIENKY